MEPFNRDIPQEADRLREIVSLIGAVENRLQRVKISLQDQESSTRTFGLEMDLKLFLIGIQLELAECPNQLSRIQSLIGQLTRMLP